MKNILSGALSIVVSCHYGFEELLAEELKEIGLKNIQIYNRAISGEADMGLVYKINYESRLALKVLIKVASFEVSDSNTLYEDIYDIPWDEIINEKNTIAINSICNQSAFDNSMFVSMRAKDAIADYFRHRTGIRPSVNNDSPDLRIQVHIFKEKATVLLDSSGSSLHQRGYRQGVNKAPINEVLAAGLIKLSNWTIHEPFYDFMCGSGTFLIEAAMSGTNTPAGYYRSSFGFEKWKNFDLAVFNQIKQEADKKRNLKVELHILGKDNNIKSLTIARENINYAGFSSIIKTQLADFNKSDPPDKPGILVMNPPYGGRLNSKENIELLYSQIGNTLKNKYNGYTAWIITANRDAAKSIGLHSSKKIIVYNGQLECRFLKFDIYEGSKKKK
ncbi:MAG: class I SAM-dependent RNA methyltransferase [Bacteroidia bacterium]|nr:class I SAM-dependent RNA methyltransferase [Bacteroidia bacterium]MCZ2248035.1 class I SAM-dependent RNA methyltransferase [Bacteroidia bacterium]